MNDIIDHEFNADFTNRNNNLELFNAVTGCCVCSNDHKTECCPVFDNLIHIEDTKVLPRALLSLPLNLKVETLSDGSKTVFTTTNFPKGTQFGPYQAAKVYSLNPFETFPLRIFDDSDTILPDYYLDSTNEDFCNWMCYVAPAKSMEEQNLICYQINLSIYYSTIRDINPGEQLKVWYSTYYAAKMGMKTFTPEIKHLNDLKDVDIQKVVENLPPKKLGALEKQNWCCKMCGQIENNVVKFAKHVQKHYMKIINSLFVCNICNAGFSTEKSLIKHRKYTHIVFTEHKPQEDDTSAINKTDSSKTNRIETCMPLQMDTLTDSDPLMMLDPLNLTSSVLYNDLNEVDTLGAILCDDSTKASNTAQEKSIEDFSLELVDTNDTLPKLSSPYICDICDKEFSNLKNLCRHLKKHTGEYTCMKCLNVFTRKENYTAHSCFIVDMNVRFNCTFCPKTFFQKKYLRRHIITHLEKYTCDKCGKKYNNQSEKNKHNCSSVAEKTQYLCSKCNQKFFRELYLKKHMLRCHPEIATGKITEPVEPNVICEICAKSFQNVGSLSHHKLTHLEPRFECKICDKKFHRKDVYNNHLSSHDARYLSCEICHKKFKLKKYLSIHMLTHGSYKYKCDECGKEFSQKANLNKHKQCVHSGENIVSCCHCQKGFKNKYVLTRHIASNHTPQKVLSFQCTICDKKFEKKFMLTKHMLNQHNDKVYSCQYCFQICKYKSSFLRHLKRNHSEIKNEWNDCDIVKSCMIDKSSVFNNLEETNVDNETEQEITLEKNAYILENGTIVQPQQGDVVFYIVNQQINQE